MELTEQQIAKRIATQKRATQRQIQKRIAESEKRDRVQIETHSQDWGDEEIWELETEIENHLQHHYM